jgi:hypothetical protein
VVLGVWLSWIAFHDAHLQFMQCKSACWLPSSSIYIALRVLRFFLFLSVLRAFGTRKQTRYSSMPC